MARSGVAKWLVCALASGLMASSVLAQAGTARVSGTVRDSAGSPVGLAQLSLHQVRGLSDSSGRFLLEQLPAGAVTLQVRRLGFAPLSVPLSLAEGRHDTISLVLASVPRSLPEVTTDARTAARLSDFYRHRQTGQGYFFNRKEIEEKRVQRLSDLARRLSGVRIMSDRQGRLHLRMSRVSGNCPPDFYIDGIRAPFLNVDDIPLQDIEALEIYRGSSVLPPEFNNRLGNPACGAVAIWTRVPG